MFSLMLESVAAQVVLWTVTCLFFFTAVVHTGFGDKMLRPDAFLDTMSLTGFTLSSSTYSPNRKRYHCN